MKKMPLPELDLGLAYEEIAEVLSPAGTARADTAPEMREFSRKRHDIVLSTFEAEARLQAPPEGASGFVYVARRGPGFDGHELAARIVASGNVFVGETEAIRSLFDGESAEALVASPFFFATTQRRRALHALVAKAWGSHDEDFFTYGVTGTNGKTSFVQMAASLLERMGPAVLRIGTLGVQRGGEAWEMPFITTPDFPELVQCLRLAQRRGARHLAMEVSSGALAEGRLDSWRMDVAVFTNFTQDHLDTHGTMERYLSAKLRLFERHLKPGARVVVNAEGEEWMQVAEASLPAHPSLHGVGGAAAEERFWDYVAKKSLKASFLRMENKISSRHGVSGTWEWNEGGAVRRAAYRSSLLGVFQHENLALAAAALLASGYDLEEVSRACDALEPIPGRMESVGIPWKPGAPTVFVDYAHTPDGLSKALESCRGFLGPGGRLHSVFGCPGQRDADKRPKMGAVADRLADEVWITSDNPRTEDAAAIAASVVSGMARSRVNVEICRRSAILKAIASASEGDIVLISGKGPDESQTVGFATARFSDREVAAEALGLSSEISRRRARDPRNPQSPLPGGRSEA